MSHAGGADYRADTMGDGMRYTLACRELGGDCDFVATGATPTEVKRAVWEHVRRDHGPLAVAVTPGMRVELDRRMDRLMGDRMR